MGKNIFVRSRSFRNALKQAGKVAASREGLSRLLNNTKSKVRSVDDDGTSQGKFFDKVFIFVRMIKAHITGDYKALPARTLILMAASLIYFITPIDLIPDFIPGIGLIDDVSIILAVFKSISSDIDDFEAFERGELE